MFTPHDEASEALPYPRFIGDGESLPTHTMKMPRMSHDAVYEYCRLLLEERKVVSDQLGSAALDLDSAQSRYENALNVVLGHVAYCSTADSAAKFTGSTSVEYEHDEPAQVAVLLDIVEVETFVDEQFYPRSESATGLMERVSDTQIPGGQMADTDVLTLTRLEQQVLVVEELPLETRSDEALNLDARQKELCEATIRYQDVLEKLIAISGQIEQASLPARIAQQTI